MNNYLRVSLITSDIIAYYIALSMAYLIRSYSSDYFFGIPLPLFEFRYFDFLVLWWIPVIVIFVFMIMDTYSFRRSFHNDIKLQLLASVISFLFVFSIISLGKLGADISRYIIVFTAIIFFIISSISKLLIKHFTQSNTVIVASDEENLEDIIKMFRSRYLGYSIKGASLLNIKQETNNKSFSIPVFQFQELKKKLKNKAFKTVIISQSNLNSSQLSSINKVCQEYVESTLIVPNITDIPLSGDRFEHVMFEKYSYFISKVNLKSFSTQAIKRSFDIVLSLMLMALFSPVFILLYLFIVIFDKHNPFYSQDRVGKKGAMFKVIKYRTMHKDSDRLLREILSSDPSAAKEWEKTQKLQNDPRITKLGKFLRKTSLDELPQLFNILSGHMSFVGPRPVIQEELERHYGEKAYYYHIVRPGLTGYWQVSGRNDTTYKTRVDMDIYYISNWSFWLDIVILIKTPFAVIFSKGAY